MLNVEKYREEMINILKSPYRKIAIKKRETSSLWSYHMWRLRPLHLRFSARL